MKELLSRCPFVPGQKNFLVPVSRCPGTRKELLSLCPEKLHCPVPCGVWIDPIFEPLKWYRCKQIFSEQSYWKYDYPSLAVTDLQATNLNQKFFKKGHIGAKINLVFGNNIPKCATLKKVITFNFSVCFDFFKVKLPPVYLHLIFEILSVTRFFFNFKISSLKIKKINLISKLIFAGYTGSKNQVWNRQKIKFKNRFTLPRKKSLCPINWGA